jgi:hypothetical protein
MKSILLTLTEAILYQAAVQVQDSITLKDPKVIQEDQDTAREQQLAKLGELRTWQDTRDSDPTKLDFRAKHSIAAPNFDHDPIIFGDLNLNIPLPWADSWDPCQSYQWKAGAANSFPKISPVMSRLKQWFIETIANKANGEGELAQKMFDDEDRKGAFAEYNRPCINGESR